MRHFCTYFDRNYLTRGLALYTSLAQCSQEPFTLWVLCFDDDTYQILSQLNLAGVQLISLQAFESGDEKLQQAKATRTPVEYYWTCTPSLPLYLLRQHPEIEIITYLDADLYFYADPQPVFDELGNNSILIVEHRYAPEYAHYAATSGIYNVGLMSFRRDENGLGCLHWWRERCLEWCYARYEDGKFGDQLYLDDWPARFNQVVILQHPGAGLAPWNLCRYQLHSTDSQIWVEEYPLIFYHFHEFKFVSRWAAKPTSYAVTLAQIEQLYVPYSQALEESGHRVSLSNGDRTESWPSQIDGLLHQRLFLLYIPLLRKVLWRLGGYNQATHQALRTALGVYYQKGALAARPYLSDAVTRNPLLLSNPTVAAALLEPVVGEKLMGQFRRLKRDITLRKVGGSR
jgi:hypothetical protein